MSFKTVEVELQDGRVRPFGLEKLPDKARALLVILGSNVAETEEVAGPSLADLMADYAGIGNGTHTDLSTNKKYMDDFGRPGR